MNRLLMKKKRFSQKQASTSKIPRTLLIQMKPSVQHQMMKHQSRQNPANLVVSWVHKALGAHNS